MKEKNSWIVIVFFEKLLWVWMHKVLWSGKASYCRNQLIHLLCCTAKTQWIENKQKRDDAADKEEEANANWGGVLELGRMSTGWSYMNVPDILHLYLSLLAFLSHFSLLLLITNQIICDSNRAKCFIILKTSTLLCQPVTGSDWDGVWKTFWKHKL